MRTGHGGQDPGPGRAIQSCLAWGPHPCLCPPFVPLASPAPVYSGSSRPAPGPLLLQFPLPETPSSPSHLSSYYVPPRSHPDFAGVPSPSAFCLVVVLHGPGSSDSGLPPSLTEAPCSSSAHSSAWCPASALMGVRACLGSLHLPGGPRGADPLIQGAPVSEGPQEGPAEEVCLHPCRG